MTRSTAASTLTTSTVSAAKPGPTLVKVGTCSCGPEDNILHLCPEHTMLCLMEHCTSDLTVPVAENNCCCCSGEHTGLLTQSFCLLRSASYTCRTSSFISRGPYNTVDKSFQAELYITLLWKFLRNKNNTFLQYKVPTFYSIYLLI